MRLTSRPTMDLIYLDNNATTPLLPAVWEAMRPYGIDVYGNPASAHRAGRKARQALEDARERTAVILGAFPDEVIFTSGGTEANNLAIFGLAGDPPGHLITSPIEHPSVAEPILQLEKRGFSIDRLPVNKEGIVPLTLPSPPGGEGRVRGERLASLIRPESRLVTVMLANNEVGSVQPIQALVDELQGRCAFHCDAVQAAGKMPVSFHGLGVTTLSISAHKFHGPKGVGALLVRRNTRLPARNHGGHQQQGRRPGTEAVALAVGLAAALEFWHREALERTQHVLKLRRLLLHRLRALAEPVVLNGPSDGGVPHTLNLSFPGCQADSLLMNLDLAGVACSTGSACSSGSLLPSPVLKAMGVPEVVLQSAMRFSLSSLLTEGEVEEASRRIAAVISRLRAAQNHPAQGDKS